MHIKRLELLGFGSYRDLTVIDDFHEGLNTVGERNGGVCSGLRHAALPWLTLEGFGGGEQVLPLLPPLTPLRHPPLLTVHLHTLHCTLPPPRHRQHR